MVGVAEYDLRPDVIGQFVLMHGFYRRCCAYGHKNRGLNHAVIGGDEARASAGVRVGMLKREIHQKRIEGKRWKVDFTNKKSPIEPAVWRIGACCKVQPRTLLVLSFDTSVYGKVTEWLEATRSL